MEKLCLGKPKRKTISKASKMVQLVKVLTTKPDDLCLILRAHEVEGKNWPPHERRGISMLVYTYT